jgi:hypothetical protein
MDDCYSEKFNAVATNHGVQMVYRWGDDLKLELPKDLRPDGKHAEKNAEDQNDDEGDDDDDDGDSVDLVFIDTLHVVSPANPPHQTGTFVWVYLRAFYLISYSQSSTSPPTTSSLYSSLYFSDFFALHETVRAVKARAEEVCPFCAQLFGAARHDHGRGTWRVLEARHGHASTEQRGKIHRGRHIYLSLFTVACLRACVVQSVPKEEKKQANPVTTLFVGRTQMKRPSLFTDWFGLAAAAAANRCLVLCVVKNFQKVGMPEAELRLGLWPAVEEFLAAHQKEWVLQQRYTNNNGLTVLKRINKNAKK